MCNEVKHYIRIAAHQNCVCLSGTVVDKIKSCLRSSVVIQYTITYVQYAQHESLRNNYKASYMRSFAVHTYSVVFLQSACKNILHEHFCVNRRIHCKHSSEVVQNFPLNPINLPSLFKKKKKINKIIAKVKNEKKDVTFTFC